MDRVWAEFSFHTTESSTSEEAANRVRHLATRSRCTRRCTNQKKTAPSLGFYDRSSRQLFLEPLVERPTGRRPSLEEFTSCCFPPVSAEADVMAVSWVAKQRDPSCSRGNHCREQLHHHQEEKLTQFVPPWQLSAQQAAVERKAERTGGGGARWISGSQRILRYVDPDHRMILTSIS